MDKTAQEIPLSDRRIPAGDDFLSSEELAKLTPAILIERCRALKPMMREDAAEAERLKRPTDRVWSAIRKSGYFYLWVPKKYGGLEAGMDTVLDCTLALSIGDPSVGWLASLTVLGNRNLGNFPVAAQDEVFGGGKYAVESGGPAPIGKAIPVEGGYRVSGRWQYGTCSVMADWIQVFASIEGPEKKLATFLMRADKAKVIDTWNTIGARATATNDIVVEDAFVPAHMVNSHIVREGPTLAAELYGSDIYRQPLAPLLAFTVAVPTVACAISAVEFYEQHLTRHTKRGTANTESANQPSQIRLAEADTMAKTAVMLLRQSMRENIAAADLKGEAQLKARNAIRAQIAYAVRISREAVIRICESTGTSIHYLDNPLQRCMRDVMVMSSHIIYDYDVTMEQHGRSKLGLLATSAIL